MRLALGASGQCLTSNGTTAVWGACGSGGGSSWSSLTNPTANLALNHGTNLTAFTFGALTGSPASDQFLIEDTTGNTSTGSIVHILGVGTSSAKPLLVESQNTAVVPMTVKVATGQTAHAFDVVNAAGTNYFTVDSVGDAVAHGNLLASGDITESAGWMSGSVGNNSNLASASNGGTITFKAADNSGSGAGGNVVIRPGEGTGTGANGTLQIIQPFVKGATYTAGKLECLSANNTVSDCSTTGASEENTVGVALGASGNSAPVVIRGEAAVTFDASSTASAGAYACLSATTAGTVTITSTACTAGQAVGILVAGVSAATSGTILVTRW